jgi:hypothetical protein
MLEIPPDEMEAQEAGEESESEGALVRGDLHGWSPSY